MRSSGTLKPWCWSVVAAVALAPASFAARITDVADAADERHPLELDLEATFTHLRSQTTVSREQFTGAGIGRSDELKHVRTVDALDLRLGIGVWHDLELHAFAPLFLRDVQDWTQAGAVSTLTTNTISPSGCAGSACGPTQPIVVLPGQSRRTGFGDPTVGIAWGPVNETRESKLRPELFPEGKPVSTWVVGLDWTFPLPGAKVDDPSRWGLNASTSGAQPAAGPASRKAQVFTLWTAFSKRYRILEPFLALSASLPFAAKSAYDNCSHPELLADVAAANCRSAAWSGQTGYKPPFTGQFTLGAELVAAEDVRGDQRFSIEARGDLRWHSGGRDYTQVSDALGKLTYSDEFVTTAATLGLYGRAARWLHLRVYGMVAVDSAHNLTHEDLANANGAFISGGTGQPAPNQNPLYDFRLDPVGRRLRAEPSTTWGIAGTLSLNF